MFLKLNGLSVCPKCGSEISYDLNDDTNSYYLRCSSKSYCGTETVSKAVAMKYPQYISASEMRELDSLIELMKDEDDD